MIARFEGMLRRGAVLILWSFPVGISMFPFNIAVAVAIYAVCDEYNMPYSPLIAIVGYPLAGSFALIVSHARRESLCIENVIQMVSEDPPDAA